MRNLEEWSRGVPRWLTRATGSLAVLAMLPALGCSSRGQEVAASGGEGVFARTCAGCHDAGQADRAPSRQALAQRSPEEVNVALKTGAMKAQGMLLSREERRMVAEYITGRKLSAVPAPLVDPGVDFCPASSGGAPELLRGPQWVAWGVDATNSRFQPAAMARLGAADVNKLEVRWAFGLPNASMVASQPTVTGGRAFFGSQAGVVYSVDARTGCIFWTYQADAGVRTAVNIARVPGNGPPRYLAIFGDQRAELYAVDALTGKEVWRTVIDSTEYAKMTATPTLYDGRVYAVLSSDEELAAQNPKYPCCKFRGSVTAVDAWTGKVVWQTFTSPDTARPTSHWPHRDRTWGPSGAPVWTEPAVDSIRHVIYVGTGNSYSSPVLPLSDAIGALDMETGTVKWSRQMRRGDAWNFACIMPGSKTCPDDPGPDYDFGSPPMLRSLPGGGRVLIAGQKTGVLSALDPDRDGALLWQVQLGKGGNHGSIMWGPAADTSTVYVALSVVDTLAATRGGGLYALRLRDGSRVWYTPSPPAACTKVPDCSGAQTAALTLIPGLVFSGSRDGHLRAYSTADGAIVWDYDTSRDFETVNKVKAHGGSLNSAGAVVVDGRVFVLSGYGFGGMPGNVLLALEPSAR